MEVLLQRISAFLGDNNSVDANNARNINFEKRTNFWYLVKKTNFAGVLYVSSVFFIVLGVIIALSANWNEISQTARISIIVLCGVNTYLIGAALCYLKKMDSLGQTLWLLSSVVLFWGLIFEFTLIDSLGNVSDGILESVLGSSGASDIILYIALPLFIVYLGSFLFFKRNILLISAVFFGITFMNSLVAVIVGERVELSDTVAGYMYLVEGSVYILLGYLFSTNEKRYLLTWPFYFLGAIMLLMGGLILINPFALTGPALLLAGSVTELSNITEFDPNVVWVVLYPMLALAVGLLALFLKKAWFVVAGLFGLVWYASYVSSYYFGPETSLWFGFVLIGVLMLVAGQMYLYVKRRRTMPVQI